MNSSHTRLKRPAPERTGPTRNPMMRAASGAASTTASIANAALRPLECGVQTAYAVIDEYMRRGYEAARGQERQTGETYMSNEKPNYGSSYGSSPYNPFSQAAPMMEQWMRFWMDAWSALVPGARPGGFGFGYGAPPSAYAPTGYATGASAPPVSVWVSSARPVEVTVNLKPGTYATDLTADSFVPPLVKSVSLQRRDG